MTMSDRTIVYCTGAGRFEIPEFWLMARALVYERQGHCTPKDALRYALEDWVQQAIFDSERRQADGGDNHA